MNKEYYKRTFSRVRPSEETLERIFDITEITPKRIRFKGLIVVAVIIALLLCGTLSANAATGGKLFVGVKALANADEVKFVAKGNEEVTLFGRITIICNGEEISLKDYCDIVTMIGSGENDESIHVIYDLTLRSDFETETESENAVD